MIVTLYQDVKFDNFIARVGVTKMIEDLNQSFIVRPWGYEIEWRNNDQYLGRVVTFYPKQILSKVHTGIQETYYLMKGSALLELGESSKVETFKTHNLYPGSVFHCPPGTIYKLSAGDSGAEFISVSVNNIKSVDIK